AAAGVLYRRFTEHGFPRNPFPHEKVITRDLFYQRLVEISKKPVGGFTNSTFGHPST
ncbi:hypothetical protein A2U01_0036745, partial [Trifolium medium]|nr:hypothetical protein [Trifolium medium]